MQKNKLKNRDFFVFFVFLFKLSIEFVLIQRDRFCYFEYYSRNKKSYNNYINVFACDRV